MKGFAITYDIRLVDFKELKKLVPYSRTTIWRLEKDNRFPKRIQLSPGRVAWVFSEVCEWIECMRMGQPWPSARADAAAHA